jgi:glycine/serine hydroxymethyltransferase
MNAITLDNGDFDPELLRALQGELRHQEEHIELIASKIMPVPGY